MLNGDYQGLRGWTNEKCYLMSIEFQFYKMKKALEIDGGDDCPTSWMYLVPWNCYLSMVKMANCVCEYTQLSSHVQFFSAS